MQNRFLPVKLLVLLVIAGFSVGAACPATEQSLLDDMKTALDRCSPVADSTSVTTFCNTAVEKGVLLVAAKPADKNARILLSSAYFGRSGIDFLDILETFSDLADSDLDDFAEIRSALSGISVNLGDLRSSVTVLTEIIANESLVVTGNEDIFRQVGLMRALEALIRPVQLAGTNAVDVNNIDADEADLIEGDFTNSDNNLVDTDIDDSDILTPIRENYCRCSLQTAVGGWSAACLRDLMRCELNPDATDKEGDNGGIEQDYNQDGTTNDVDCITLLTPASLSTCSGSNV